MRIERQVSTLGKKENLIVGVDIGTTKICAIVGEIEEDGIDIVGIGTHPSRGLRKGVVVNIESTVESIKKVIEEAELMAGCEISSVYTGIAGGHIKGFNSQGVIAIKEREVKETDVRRVVDAARAVAIPMDREVIHILPQEFIIDNQDGIKEPLGMSGVRLEAKVHIVTGAVTSAQNIIKCIHRTGLNVSDIVLQSLASAEAVLNQDEKDLGVALVDIGGGTTDIAIFIDGSIKHTSVISLGGNHITGDIAVGLRTPAAEAEKIKKKYGCAVTTMVSREETIEVPSVGGRKPRLIPRQKLAEIIEPRVEEILSLVIEEINASGFRDLIASGAVVTGGTAILEGLPEMAEELFDLPVRRGSPTGIGGLVDVVNSPIYATGVGLVLYGSKNQTINKFRLRDNHIFGKVRYRMQEWFSELF
ncbi:MAG: cell division protein FtsA [Deltaproteobacteria bacterium]|nr:MAG: cell division protein FtsA [Deltaproteobacteria bacterium]